jgi:hypothetical protein
MKKVMRKEVEFCDGCNAETYVTACMKCGVDHCWQCQEKWGVEYAHGVYVKGSGDGYWCKPCDVQMSESGSDELYLAYVAIRQVRDEMIAFNAEWSQRKDAAESRLKQLQEQKR